MTKTHWEIHQYTLVDGWINTWTDTDENGNETPTIFASEQEACAALEDLLDTIQEQIDNGERDESATFTRDEFILVCVEAAQ